MSDKDRFFEYKMPITFYGQVVDETGAPIAGATVRFAWTDLSNEGTSKRESQSDGGGVFSLEGVLGKGLTVYVRKVGYKHYFAKNRFSFEYAMFADPKYHVPDPAHPVMFVLRKDREAEPLVVRENQEAELQPGESKSFALGPDGAAVTVERLPDTDQDSRSWSARVSVLAGGVMLTTDEFPFEAPETGYVPSLEITNQTQKPPVWSGDNGAVLFVKTATGYGRIVIRNTPGMAWVYLSSYFNPKLDSRNLEPNTAKAIEK